MEWHSGGSLYYISEEITYILNLKGARMAPYMQHIYSLWWK